MVVDAVHGQIHLNDCEVRVIDTPTFQRLRHLKQLAMAQMVYPTATHTRFAHSLGALGTMKRILDSAKENGVEFREEEQDDLRLAALLHDVGHYPYSHLMEKLDKVKLIEEDVENATPTETTVELIKATPYPKHEELGRLIVTSQPDVIDAIGGKGRAEKVADIFTRSGEADPQLSKFIHSSFDIDRWDYLLRDSHATGLPYGHIDIDYLLNNVRVSPEKRVGFADKALPAIEHFLLARFFMHRVAYYHKTIYGMEESCRQLLRRLRDRYPGQYGVPDDGEAVKNLVTSPKLHTFTDGFVDDIVRQAVNHQGDDEWDNVIRTLARSIQSRTPPKLLKEVQICVEKGEQYHAGKMFIQNCKSKLKDLSSGVKIPLGQFLLCEVSVPIIRVPSERRVSEIARMKPSDLAAQAHKEEEEDIKIFRDDQDEPSSLLDVEYSLVVKYAEYSLQIFRLYVVYDGEDREEKIKNLRQQVKDWSS
jgi:hypothetical protein